MAQRFVFKQNRVWTRKSSKQRVIFLTFQNFKFNKKKKKRKISVLQQILIKISAHYKILFIPVRKGAIFSSTFFNYPPYLLQFFYNTNCEYAKYVWKMSFEGKLVLNHCWVNKDRKKIVVSLQLIRDFRVHLVSFVASQVTNFFYGANSFCFPYCGKKRV